MVPDATERSLHDAAGGFSRRSEILGRAEVQCRVACGNDVTRGKQCPRHSERSLVFLSEAKNLTGPKVEILRSLGLPQDDKW